MKALLNRRCPEAAKVATVEIKTPLLPNPLEGAAYLATQNANPFGTLVALYIVAQDPVSGVLVKLAGEVKPNPVTGQLVSTFKETPQLPFEDLKLHFFGGSQRAAGDPGAVRVAIRRRRRSRRGRGTPPAESVLGVPDHLRVRTASPCADPLPFAPSLTAGTTSIQAGGFSPFTMTMSPRRRQAEPAVDPAEDAPGAAGDALAR